MLADDLNELLDLAALFAHLPRPGGRNVAILSSPGGLAVIAADLAEKYGLEVPLLSESSCARLGEILPGQGISTANPVDLGFGALKPGIYREALRILDEDPSIDIMVTLGGAPSSQADDAHHVRILHGGDISSEGGAEEAAGGGPAAQR